MTSFEDARLVADTISWLAKGLNGDQIAYVDDFAQLTQKICKLKELSRVKADAEAVYTSNGITTLAMYAFSPGNETWSHEAKRCLANALTLEDRCVPYFLQGGGLSCLRSLGREDSQLCTYEVEFLYSRILFLVTAKAGHSVRDDLLPYREECKHVVTAWYSRHLEWTSMCGSLNSYRYVSRGPRITALCETLKLLYNLSLFVPEFLNDLTFQDAQGSSVNISRATLQIISHLNAVDEASSKVVLPHCINLLTNTQLETIRKDELRPVLSILEQHVESVLQGKKWYGQVLTEDQLAPLFTFLARLYDASVEDTELRQYMELCLLVQDSERHKPLGQTDSVASKLLKLLNTTTQTIRECISALLYQVSGSNASTFAENIGYGHAIGFLTAHGIAFPQDQIPSKHNGKDINPITGQTIEAEAADQAQRDLREMSDEEKEREAEKLFVLFQRLKKNGVINVQDPIQQAVDSGRFTEM